VAREQIETAVRLDVRAAVARVETAYARQTLAASVVAQAQERQRIVRDRYEMELLHEFMAQGKPVLGICRGAQLMNVALGGWSFGAQFGDLNNDGALDLYLVNGYVSASRNENYWYDYSKVAGGHEVVIGDAANWPAMGTRSLAGYQPKRVWMNDGAGRFIDVARMVGVTDERARRHTLEYDRNGRLISWIDTAGHAHGTMGLRWNMAIDPPQPVCRVARFDDLVAGRLL